MASDKQIEANRLNSQKSTGPKTEGGKAIVSKNAIKHGLLSSQSTLPWENGASVEELRKNLNDSIQPIGQLEEILTDRAVSLIWRLRRATRIETGIFHWERFLTNFDFLQNSPQTFDEKVFIEMKGPLPPEETKELTDQIKHSLATKRTNNPEDTWDLSTVFSDHSNSLNNLHRYETGLERSLFKTLHELQRLQAFRTGKDAHVPVAVDILGDGDN